MLTCWLAAVLFLAASGHPQRAWGGVFVAPPCRVKGHSEAGLTLGCGDGETPGVVQHWHTPFGQVQGPGARGPHWYPFYMQHDGSLVVPRSSTFHSGLYYCLLQHTAGTTVWWYQLQILPDRHSQYWQEGPCRGLRVRSVQQERSVSQERLVGAVARSVQQELSVSQERLVGAVAVSVVLAFVVGFSAGALSRTHMLRCLQAVGGRLTSLHQRQDPLDPHSEVNMSTLSQESTTPPPKPQRSFKRDDLQQHMAYLESCDYSHRRKEGARQREEEHTYLSAEEVKGAEEEERSVEEVWSAEEEGSVEERGAEEEERSVEEVRSEEEVMGAAGDEMSAEEVMGTEEEVSVDKERSVEGGMGAEEEVSVEEERSVEEVMGAEEEVSVEEERSVEEVMGEEEVKGAEEVMGTEEDRKYRETDRPEGSRHSREECLGRGKSEGTEQETGRGPRVRVIRLYQYNEDGQRYCHLPGPSPQDQGPLPTVTQRSLSLTRLRAIMAAASGGPKEVGSMEAEQGGDEAHFHREA